MSEHNGKPDWPTPAFFENRLRFPHEELLKFAGKHIAWNADGTRIVDSDADEGALYDRLKAAGYDMARTVFSYVEDEAVESRF